MKKKLVAILGGVMVFVAAPAFAATSETPYCAPAWRCYQQDAAYDYSCDYPGGCGYRGCVPARARCGW